jgi:hypothetical protein
MSEHTHRRRWLFCVIVSALAAPIIAVGYLRFAAIPVEEFPAEVRKEAGWVHGVHSDRMAPSHGATRAKIDHLINPLPDFRRHISFDHVFTTAQLPGERFLVFYDLGAGDAALAYRCAADGRLISKGSLDVSP